MTRALILLLAAVQGVQPENVPQNPAVDQYGDPLPSGAVARMGTVRFRAHTRLEALACFPDGKWLAAADGNIIRLWDTATGKEIRTCSGHRELIRCLDISSDGRLIASGENGSSLRIWDATTGQELCQCHGHEGKDREGGVWQVLFTRDGRSLISRGGDNTIRLWDVKSGKELRQFRGHREQVRDIAVAADGQTVAAFSRNEKRNRPAEAWLWELSTGKPLRHWPIAEEASPAAFSANLHYLVTSGGGLKIWDLKTGDVVCSLRASLGAVFLANEDMLIHVGYQGIRFWKIPEGTEIRALPRTPWSLASSRLLSPDCKTVMTWGFERALRFWDLDTGNERKEFDGHALGVFRVAFTSDGKRLASADRQEIRLWEISEGKEMQRFNIIGAGNYLNLSADGRAFLTRSNRFVVLDMITGHETPVPIAGASWFQWTAFSPDGKTLALAGPSTFEKIIWDIAAGKPRFEWQSQSDRVSAPTFSPDGKMIAAGGWREESGKVLGLNNDPKDFAIFLWDADTGKELPPIGKHPRFVDKVAFSPDGRTLVGVGFHGPISLWEISTGQQRGLIEPGGPVSVVSFSPNGRILATVNGDHSYDAVTEKEVVDFKGRRHVRLWDLATGKEIHRFSGHFAAVQSLAFSPDGRLLASGSFDTTVLLWDMTPIYQKARLRPLRLDDKELDALWADLSGADGAKADRAIWTLAAAAEQSVPFLKERMPPVFAADPKQVARLLAALESDSFSARQSATRELEKLGPSVRPALRRALDKQPSVETRRRLEMVLALPDNAPPVGLRTVEVLERIATPRAQEHLQALAMGVPDARLTQDAKESLERLSRLRTGK